jgi:16S rRNA processing protein RimM
MTEPQTLVVGRVGRPQGVRGEVTVEVRTDDPDARFAAGSVLLTEPAERGPLTVTAVRPRSGGVVLAFDGVTDREGAEALRDTVLLVDAASLPAIEDPDEFYDHQLVGLAAVDAAGAALGTVADVVHAPATDLLVVRDGDGREHLIPFVRDMVPSVDVPAGRVVVAAPEGLFDL